MFLPHHHFFFLGCLNQLTVLQVPCQYASYLFSTLGWHYSSWYCDECKESHFTSPDKRTSTDGETICSLGPGRADWADSHLAKAPNPLRYTFPPKQGSFKCVNPTLIAQTCHMKTELGEWLMCTVHCCLFSSPFPLSEISNKPTCKKKKKNVIPCLAGVQVRNVPTYFRI